MLTDIFAERYATRQLWDGIREEERRLLVQAIKLVSRQVLVYYKDGNPQPGAEARWNAIHDKLAVELGLSSLSPKAYSYISVHNGVLHTSAGLNSIHTVCEQ